MYFRRLSKSSTWHITGNGLDVTARETEGGIEASGKSFPDLASAMRFFGVGTSAKLIGPAKDPDTIIQLDTGDGETYKIKRQEDGLKLWGKSIKVTVFPTWVDLFSNFDQVFFKKIEVFEEPEYICTDSKGRFVATIVKREDGWKVTMEDETESVKLDLNDAMETVLLAL